VHRDRWLPAASASPRSGLLLQEGAKVALVDIDEGKLGRAGGRALTRTR
jgi:hypothetical protein